MRSLEPKIFCKPLWTSLSVSQAVIVLSDIWGEICSGGGGGSDPGKFLVLDFAQAGVVAKKKYNINALAIRFSSNLIGCKGTYTEVERESKYENMALPLTCSIILYNAVSLTQKIKLVLIQSDVK